MSKLFSVCNCCKKRKFFVKKWTFTVPQLGQPMTSLNDLCYKCYKHIKGMV